MEDTYEKTGGPATGLTMLDWFAGQSLAIGRWEADKRVQAKEAFDLAEALIRERNRRMNADG